MTDAPAPILVLNAGSSSLKAGLYGGDAPALWQGQIEGLEDGGAPALVTAAGREPLPLPPGAEAQARFAAALACLFGALAAQDRAPVAVAHRIVHGGDRFVAPCRLTPADIAALHALDPLAPLHQPHNLAVAEAAAAAWPELPQIGVFDTAFHATLPEVERRLPLADDALVGGVRRYGFHGLSYAYVSEALRGLTPRAQGRVLIAHLGNGASLCGVVAGRSTATTMGFSALDGLMMGSRCGSLDPGVVLHLWRAGWSREAVEALLYRRSGLLGVSGVAADMRQLRASSAPAAQAAIALYTHRIVREAGALAAALGGLDALVFTAGIGENDAALRRAVCAGLAHLGVAIDVAANAAPPPRPDPPGPSQAPALGRPIHAAASAVEVWVVPTDEGRVAARAAQALLSAPALR